MVMYCFFSMYVRTMFELFKWYLLSSIKVPYNVLSTWYIAQYQLGKNEGLRLKFCGLVQYWLPAQTTSAWILRCRRKIVVKFEKNDFLSQTIYQTIEENYWNFLWHAFMWCFETLHFLDKYLVHQIAVYKKWLFGNF